MLNTATLTEIKLVRALSAPSLMKGFCRNTDNTIGYVRKEGFNVGMPAHISAFPLRAFDLLSISN